MRRPVLIVFVLVLVVLVGFWWTHRGYDSRRFTDLSRPFSLSVSAPPFSPLRPGSLFVLVEGRLDGDAVLQVYSNHGRDYREIHLRAPSVADFTGGPEEWVDDLRVDYQPGSAKAGDLYIAVYCGARFTEADWERFRRISATR